jgi:hypothetical protein
MKLVLSLLLVSSIVLPCGVTRSWKRLYTTVAKVTWPTYPTEQAFLISDITLRENKLTLLDAYDRDLKPKIEKAASQVCPSHSPTKCMNCWRPQIMAFSQVSESLYDKVRKNV